MGGLALPDLATVAGVTTRRGNVLWCKGKVTYTMHGYAHRAVFARDRNSSDATASRRSINGFGRCTATTCSMSKLYGICSASGAARG